MTHVLADAAAFFAEARRIVGGRLDAVQVDTINRLLVAAGHWRTSWMAYGLATGWHEARLRPAREKGSGDGPDADPWDDYLEKYDTGRLAQALGNTPEADGDGVRYAGRGLPQLTGLANYRKASAALGVDFVSHPDKLLEPEHAVAVMVWGMEVGAFTGKALRHYLPDRLGTPAQFIAARRIINGTDRAASIAALAERFQQGLEAGGWAR